MEREVMEDAWELFYNTAKWLRPRLQVIRDKQAGYPVELTQASWNQILDKIISAMDLILLDDDLSLSFEENAAVDEGCMLLGKWFRHLWI